MPSLGGWELVIIVGVLVLLFGAKKLPDMARSVGQSARVFKGEMKGLKNDETLAAAHAAPEPAAAPAASPSQVPPAVAPVATSPAPVDPAR